MRRHKNLTKALAGPAFFFLLSAAVAFGQAADSAPQSASASAPAPVITLEEAIHRAQTSDPAFAAAQGASKSARLDREIAVAGLLPTVHLYSQDIYMQPNGLQAEGGEGDLTPNPKFVSYDARPWEYIAQGVVDESIGFAGTAAVRRANAAAAQAAAEQEIARRGLIAGVTALFYTSLAADHKLAVARSALQEANDFEKITTEREQAREAAHADVIKAQLGQQTRQREVQDAQVAAEKARLELGVLLFPDPRTPYTLSAPEAAPPLASRDDIDAAAAKNNPELRSALAALGMSKADLLSARAAFLPEVHLNLAYGIDANNFGVNGPLLLSGTKANNLGYSTSFTVNLPVWDWFSTEHKVKQSEIRRQVAQVTLTNTQRQLIARLDEAYSEATIARDQLASLDQSVSIAAESLRLTRLAYQGGDGTVLEVVDAQNAYVAAQIAREDGRVRYENARANLQTLTGTM